MTRDEILRLALLAAAKVAFPAAILGCGGAIAQEPITASDAGTIVRYPSANDAASPTPVLAEAGASCDIPVYAPPPASAIACCKGEVASAWPDGGTADSNPPTAATLQCCSVLVAAAEADPTNNPLGEDRFHCCQALHWPGGATCTPWGPPTPPAMPSMEVA